MGNQLIESLLPDGLQDVYRKVYTSVDDIEDERVKLALISVLYAMHKDTADPQRQDQTRSNVVPFIRPIAG